MAPAAIVRAADAADVARVVDLARETGAELAVRSSGHSRAGHGTSEGGIILDLSAMNAVEIADFDVSDSVMVVDGPLIADRSRMIPPSDVPCPARLWPLLRTASWAPFSRARSTTRATSAASVARTIAAGDGRSW